jgi:itaconate CoA-transferase
VSHSALSGVRIVALEHAAAGPFATHLLADMGAEIIKIERPGTGDTIRSWDRAVRGMSSGFTWLNRAKRSVTVDITTAGGATVMRKLVEHSDVFITNIGPKSVERLDLGWERLHDLNPRLVYCAVTGYGLTGPYREAKAFDLLIQGEAGIIATTGSKDAPAKVGVPISDIAAGMYAALGITLALYQRERTGEGQLIDIGMFDSVLDWLAYFPHHFWHQGEEPERVGMRHHYIVPYGPYLARDGVFVNIAIGARDNWVQFCEMVIRRPELVNDKRFVDPPTRRLHRDEITKLIEDIIASEDSETWFARLADTDVPYGRLRGIAEVLAHPQVAARRIIREVASPVGPVPTIESPLRLSSSPIADGPIPGLGADTDAVLESVGFSSTEVAELRASGAI